MKKFLFYCLPARLLLVLLAYLVGNKYTQYKNVTAILAICVALGLTYAEFYGNPVGAFGSKRYWPGFIHGALYLLFGVMLFMCPKHAWVVLLTDIIIGTGVVLKHYISV